MKTGLLLVAMTCLLVLIGQVVGGTTGAVVMFGIAAALNFFTFFMSDTIVLKMYRAQPVEQRSDAPALWDAVERGAQAAGLPMPRVYIVPQPTPNAFATGRSPKHAAVAATEGILRILSEEELDAVVAHELAHVKHRDTLIQTIVATVAGAIMLLASVGRFALIFGGDDEDNPLGLVGSLVMLIIAPIAAVLIQMWISRTREFAADEGGATISGNPLALASALRRMEATVSRRPMAANPSTAHLFIVNPFSGQRAANLFSTHPTVDDRVARLEALARKGR
ncbi:MAG: zinc metalloprotease HtpX [Candidatus Brocadiia bacterium]